ncbi:hypothetical protein KAR91_32025 [Candidatus Pacearchaeota archaeon]|nr:hypothetical protein [Candidatus Pacearchaeota archaeon]
MIVSALIFIIVILSVLQDNKRLMTSLIYSFLTLCHELFFKELDGYLYFLTCALIDVSIISIIARLKYRTKLTANLIIISTCFIFLNSLSWVLWENSINYEFAYEPIAAILYLCVVVSMLNWDGVEDGNYKFSDWLRSLRVDHMANNHNYKKL